MPTITFDELMPRERLRLWWEFLWRGFVISVCGFIGGAVAGFVIGFTIGLLSTILGHNVQEPGVQLLIKVLAATGGFVVGLVLSWHYLRWLFRTRLGSFRLLLVRESSDAAV